VLIVGGTYQEEVKEPADRRIAGSGLRGAAAVNRLSPSTSLVSAIETTGHEPADAAAAAYGVRVQWLQRSSPITFVYRTPISSASRFGEATVNNPPRGLTSDVALVYGQVEGNTFPAAEALIIDPQYSINLKDIRSVQAARIAIVANLHETRGLTGLTEPYAAARRLLRDSRASVVVTKMGARGLLVSSGEGQVALGPRPVKRVWPIGSGDVFSAVFACAWGERNMDPVAAAAAASLGTSIYCETRHLPLPADLFERRPSLAQVDLRRRVRVYLAGPFFSIAERWFVSLVYDGLQDLGATVFSPMHDVGRGGDEVAKADIKGLAQSNSLLALLEHGDVGTAFEAGWATRGSKAVVVYVEGGVDAEGMKMLAGTGALICSDLSSALYWAIWAGMKLKPS
jgi:hypothetical protein